MNYTGQICNHDQLNLKINKKEANYVFRLIEIMDKRTREISFGAYIDARNEGNLARFINHSCDFNCIFEIVMIIVK
jgi:SET domain-containing protein